MKGKGAKNVVNIIESSKISLGEYDIGMILM